MQQRSRLFFCQKLVNMAGMITAAALPSALAFLLRLKDATSVDVRCDYLYHPNSSSTEVLHGTLPGQLVFLDAHPIRNGVIINKTSELCVSGAGDFCYEVCMLDLLAPAQRVLHRKFLYHVSYR